VKPSIHAGYSLVDAIGGQALPRKKLLHSPARVAGVNVVTMSTQITFPPLETVNRPTVETASAAHYLNRRPQTLRGWACLETGPVRPLRVNGRLAWPVSEIRRLLGVSA
jgi:hypothetical protein